MIGTLQSEGAAAAGVDRVTAVTLLDYWLECNGSRQADYDSLCPTGQTFARYLTVDIQKTYTPMFNLHLAGQQADGSVRTAWESRDPYAMRKLRTCLLDKRGVAAVEMALSLPVLLLFIYGIFEVGVMLNAVAGMQSGLGEGARYATIYADRLRMHQIRSKIQAHVFGLGVGTFGIAVHYARGRIQGSFGHFFDDAELRLLHCAGDHDHSH